MDQQLSQLKEQILKIDELKGAENWGPEFQLWEKETKRLVREIFGEEGFDLFTQQQTMTTSYIDSSYNIRQYQKELDNRRRILEGLLSGVKEEKNVLTNEDVPNPNIVLKKIWRKEAALKENLLPTTEVEKLHKSLILHLENIFIGDSLPSLRFKKIKAGKPVTWWSSETGYPLNNPWGKFQPFLDLLEQHEAERTIKNRLKTEGFFIESRSQGEDQHLLIGKRDGTSEKAHIIIDGKSGEIRIEDNQQEPTELVAHIETILTLQNGKRIRTTREAIKEISVN